MLIFTQTENGNYLRLIKNPKGPTITFKIEEYALARDVIKHVTSKKKQAKIFTNILQAPPLLIMNGFTAAAQAEGNDVMKIVSLMLQSLFPPIKIHEMNLSTCKRVVMFNKTEGHSEENGQQKDGEIEFRHYGVSARQRAINRGIKKIVNKKKLPDLSKFNDIADYILRGQRDTGAYSSESELDDLPGSKITLPDDYQDRKKGTQVAVRLHELGPRIKL